LSREKLVALERLQVVDLEIEELTKQADAFPARMAALTAEVTKARSAADLERGRLADNERARRQAESSLTEETDKVKKWESRLPQLKHPREFAALEREITSAKKANEATELLLAELKVLGEPLRTLVIQKEAELAKREAALAAEAANLQQSESSLRERAENLKHKRDDERKAVDPKLLSTYELVRKRRGGRVVVEIANGSCTGCHRKLLPQLNNAILNGHIETCPACQRLLYAPKPPPEAQG
jgi:predicted  nucleic acid-binding Zn-ribbon protein